MIVFSKTDVPQGSDQWFELRMGRPTASEFSNILTPAKGQKSASQRGFAARHVDERVHSGPKDKKEGYASKEMERGSYYEAEARRTFERDHELVIREVGFVTTDDGRFGCSPDGLIYPLEGELPISGLELKNYSAEQHLLWQEEPVLPNEFKCQVHGCMVVTGLKTWWWRNYHPPYDPVDVLVQWDGFTDQLKAALEEFDEKVFRPMLARQCENRAVREQVERFDAKYSRMLNQATKITLRAA